MLYTFTNSSIRTKKLLKTIELPTQLINNLAFGGPFFDKLFVTTGSTAFNFDSGTIADDTLTPSAGEVFVIENLGTRGFPGYDLGI